MSKNSNLIEVYDKPINGKLFVVGDIHGCYDLLMRQLKQINFDFNNDLLVSVGDMVIVVQIALSA